jgi:F-type H+-transporting ATPase subunit delta
MTSLNDSALAHQYSLALMEEATEHGCLDQVLSDLTQLASIMGSDSQITEFFNNHVIPDSEKTTVLESQFLPNVSPLTGRLLTLLAQKQRLMLVPAVAQALLASTNANAGMATVKVQSAMPLDSELANRLSTRLKDAFGLQSVQLDMDIQPGLLSGLVVEWRDVRLDASLLGQFSQLERSLVGRSL